MATFFLCALLGVLYMAFITKHEVVAVVACGPTSSSPATIRLTCSNNQMIHVIRETYGNKGEEVVAVVACETTSSSPAAIHLTCRNNQMIHVIRETYGDKGQGETCLETMDSCTKSVTSDRNGLVVNCNGKQTCGEVSMSLSSDCDPTNLTFEIEYECIEDSIDICRPISKSMNGYVYLHSPGFPDSVGINDSCHCNITGLQMTVMLAEHRAQQGVVTLSIANMIPWDSTITSYNRIIASRTGFVFLNYDNDNRSDENVWIRLADSGLMNVTCWRGTAGPTMTNPGSSSTTNSAATFSMQLTASQTSKITTQPSPDAYPTTATPSVDNAKDDQPHDGLNANSTIVMVAAVCGVVIFLLLITIVTLLVYFKVIKPARNKPSKKKEANITEIPNTEHAPYEDVSGTNTEQQRSRDTSNTYNDLCRYENTDGAHEYGKIHLYSDVK